MGLDLSHGDFSCGYGYFNYFRTIICLVAGYGDYDDYCHSEKNYNAEQDSIHILLTHSDCDGEISFEDCQKLLPRLQEIVDKTKDTYPDIHKTGLEFIGSLKEAIEYESALYFD